MPLEAEAWFKEKIKDLINVQYQAIGGHLDGTMMGGDEEAGTYKFPIIGRLKAVKLTGAIQPVQAGEAEMTTVQMSPEDFEASAWVRTQDLYKMGPNQQQGLARLLTMAIRRTRDEIKRDALHKFTEDVPTQDIGGANVIINPMALETARAEIAATGADDFDLGTVFCPIPEMWMSQLCQYKQWNDADYRGPSDLPWSKAAREKAKTVRGVHYFTMPDEMFLSDDDEVSILTHMWARSAVGAETPWSKEAPNFTQHHEFEGSPWLGKTSVGGCAVGIQRKGVKKIRFQKITEITEIPILTKEAA
jgi:hypothetical protein